MRVSVGYLEWRRQIRGHEGPPTTRICDLQLYDNHERFSQPSPTVTVLKPLVCTLPRITLFASLASYSLVNRLRKHIRLVEAKHHHWIKPVHALKTDSMVTPPAQILLIVKASRDRLCLTAARAWLASRLLNQLS